MVFLPREILSRFGKQEEGTRERERERDKRTTCKSVALGSFMIALTRVRQQLVASTRVGLIARRRMVTSGAGERPGRDVCCAPQAAGGRLEDFFSRAFNAGGA